MPMRLTRRRAPVSAVKAFSPIALLGDTGWNSNAPMQMKTETGVGKLAIRMCQTITGEWSCNRIKFKAGNVPAFCLGGVFMVRAGRVCAAHAFSGCLGMWNAWAEVPALRNRHCAYQGSLKPLTRPIPRAISPISDRVFWTARCLRCCYRWAFQAALGLRLGCRVQLQSPCLRLFLWQIG